MPDRVGIGFNGWIGLFIGFGGVALLVISGSGTGSIAANIAMSISERVVTSAVVILGGVLLVQLSKTSSATIVKSKSLSQQDI